MEELDWSDVPVSRRAETSRRIAVLRRYLAIVDPTPADRDAAQAELGVGRATFYNLVRAWTKSGRPADLPGAAAPKEGRRRGPALADGVAEAIETAMRTLPGSASLAEIHREVARLCALTGTRPPSVDPIARRLREREAERPVHLVGSPRRSLVVDSCALAIPTRIGRRVALPVVTAVFQEEDGRIAAHHVDFAPPTATTGISLLEPLFRRRVGNDRVLLNPWNAPGWSIVMHALEPAGMQKVGDPSSRVPGGMFADLANGHLGGLPLARKSTLDPEADSTSGRPRPEVEELIARAIEIHNSARAGIAETDEDGASIKREAVLQILRWLIQMPQTLAK